MVWKQYYKYSQTERFVVGQSWRYSIWPGQVSVKYMNSARLYEILTLRFVNWGFVCYYKWECTNILNIIRIIKNVISRKQLVANLRSHQGHIFTYFWCSLPNPNLMKNNGYFKSPILKLRGFIFISMYSICTSKLLEYSLCDLVDSTTILSMHGVDIHSKAGSDPVPSAVYLWTYR